MGKKIRCVVCHNQENSICVLKGNKVSINKSRHCELFNFAAEKVKPIKKMEAVYTPFHLRDRKAYKKYAKEQAIIQQRFDQQNAVANGVSISSVDCLARYRTTQGATE